MLRITTQETDRSILLLLEGKLNGPWVAELERAFSDSKSTSVGRPIIVDLKGLTRADAAGRDLLALLVSEGANLQNWSPLSSALVARTVVSALVIGGLLSAGTVAWLANSAGHAPARHKTAGPANAQFPAELPQSRPA